MKLLSVVEVAERLRVNKSVVYKLNKAGLLPLIKIGSLKCREQTLDDFVKSYENKDISDPFNVKDLI